MRLYLAGWQASRRKREERVIKEGGLSHRMFSFANLQKIGKFPYFIKGFQGSYEACVENKVGIAMDSGVVSYRGYMKAQMKAGADLSKLPSVEEFIEAYVAYVKANQKHWDFYLSVDMMPQAEDAFKWHTKVEKMGINPVPVFHGDVGVEWLQRYLDKGQNYIALGGFYLIRRGPAAKRAYMDAIFNWAAKKNARFHGLGATTPSMLLAYDYYSVDSSWWTRTAGYGSIMRFDPIKERMSILHISPRYSNARGQEFKMNPRAMEGLRKELKEEGYDLEVLQNDFTERHIYNAKTMQVLCAAATKRHKTGWNLFF